MSKYNALPVNPIPTYAQLHNKKKPVNRKKHAHLRRRRAIYPKLKVGEMSERSDGAVVIRISAAWL